MAQEVRLNRQVWYKGAGKDSSYAKKDCVRIYTFFFFLRQEDDENREEKY